MAKQPLEATATLERLEKFQGVLQREKAIPYLEGGNGFQRGGSFSGLSCFMGGKAADVYAKGSGTAGSRHGPGAGGGEGTWCLAPQTSRQDPEEMQSQDQNPSCNWTMPAGSRSSAGSGGESVPLSLPALRSCI